MPPRPTTVDQIRESYLAFFAAKGCTRYPSAPLVNENDPTTLFTVAGMSQFKDMFLGRGSHPFTRATTCQKCMRTNDILQVGRTPRHHTFFEMLGNFSFNDYFKRETITWAWEYLTQVLGLDPERLRITVHTIDDEAWNIWRDEVGIPASRMERLGDGDNFWPANAPAEGPMGPGGCCSEIFWDFRPEEGQGSTPGTDKANRYVEIWNLVFPQFNVREPRTADGRLTLDNLGRTNIDTGSGLERVACVVQGKRNNFDIDSFRTIIESVCSVSGAAYREGVLSRDAEGERLALIRRIADHTRAVTFAIADKARPGNKGAGYVLKRLIRRATLDIDRLGVEQPSLHRIVPAVVAAMSGAYPELTAAQDRAASLIEAEESQFRATLRRGLGLLNKNLDEHKRRGAPVFDGEAAFHLYETDGFPREITEEILADQGLKIDDAGWQRAETAHQQVSRSREAQVFAASALLDAKNRLGATRFVGYDAMGSASSIQLIEIDGVEAGQAPAGSAVRFAMSPSPFYAESGGQVGDRGSVRAADGSFTIAVVDVQKDDGLWLHRGQVTAGVAKPGVPVHAEVDAASRAATIRHHSATHLLHSALCRTLGPQVEQQGSKVEPAGLRFDFNHDAALSDSELAAVESWVNQQIAARHAVRTDELPVAEARARGAKALFGEKYGATVRMVTMGGADVSIELCGGCHVRSTGDIARFRIVREEASAAGIRRVSAVAGAVAEALEAEETGLARRCAQLLGVQHAVANQVPPLARLLRTHAGELPERVQALVAEDAALHASLQRAVPALTGATLVELVQNLQERGKNLRRDLERSKAQAAAGAVQGLLAQAKACGAIKLLVANLPDADAKSLRQAIDGLLGNADPLCAVLGSVSGGKAVLVAGANAAALARGAHAGTIIQRLAPIVGGKGGGKDNAAQGGGPDGAKLGEALAAVPALLADLQAAAAR